MKALDISKKLNETILNKEFEGIVHSVFDNSFNVLTEDNKFITFLNSKKLMSPYSIRIEEDVSFLDKGIKPRVKVQILSKLVSINELDIKIYYSAATLWDEKPNLTFSKDVEKNVDIKLERIEEVLLTEGKKNGIFPLLITLKERIGRIDWIYESDMKLGKNEIYIREKFLEFIDSYIKGDIEKLSVQVKNIIGFGIGLTPSMDDFLAGLMVSGIYLHYYLGYSIGSAYEINYAMVKDIKNRTTRVSEEMLIFSSEGEVNEDIRDLMISFLGDASLDMFSYNLRRVINIGETSGTDILLGIYIGSLILLN
ncbi:MAG TPA: DUF2877 domain-containing protein [Tissierellales bacterium]|nr:DUF2877 domain-containing protein [Tissierellales bacterium]